MGLSANDIWEKIMTIMIVSFFMVSVLAGNVLEPVPEAAVAL